MIPMSEPTAAVVSFTQTLRYDGALHRDVREAVYGRDYLGPTDRPVFDAGTTGDT